MHRYPGGVEKKYGTGPRPLSRKYGMKDAVPFATVGGERTVGPWGLMSQNYS